MSTLRLKLARRGFYSGGGFSGTYTPLAVSVRNLGYEKQVAVLYTPDGLAWKEHPLAFVSTYGDHDLFGATLNEQVAALALRYTVAGQTWFDNNGGWNYNLSSRLTLVGGNVALYLARARRGVQAGGGFTFDTSWLEGEIVVNNLAYSKDVGVRLSIDGGVTWHDTPAFYAGETTSNGIYVGTGGEVWRFKTPELNMNATPEFRFAAYYYHPATGETFWDNNLGQDFRLSKADGAMME